METFSCKLTMFDLIYFESKRTPANFVCKFVDKALLVCYVTLCWFLNIHVENCSAFCKI